MASKNEAHWLNILPKLHKVSKCIFYFICQSIQDFEFKKVGNTKEFENNGKMLKITRKLKNWFAPCQDCRYNKRKLVAKWLFFNVFPSQKVSCTTFYPRKRYVFNSVLAGKKGCQTDGSVWSKIKTLWRVLRIAKSLDLAQVYGKVWEIDFC